MSFNDYGIGTHTCGEAVVACRRVSLNSSDALVYADADKTGIGVTRNPQDNGEDVGVAYINKPGTHEICAAGAFSIGDKVYAAADGKVQAIPTAAGTYYQVGLAMEAATADGDLVEILIHELGTAVTVSE